MRRADRSQRFLRCVEARDPHSPLNTGNSTRGARGTAVAAPTLMLASLESASVVGIHASPVHVEVDLCFGLPRFQLVGLPDTSVKESRDRVHAAIRNSGFEFPQHRIVITMAPADVRKAGASYDLPIALGVLAASGVVNTRDIRDIVIVGELTLDGSIHPARGVLPIAVGARRAGATSITIRRLGRPPNVRQRKSNPGAC